MFNLKRMPRNDGRRPSYHDDPAEYFRRLQSYAPSRTDSYANDSTDLYTPSDPSIYSPSKPKPARPRLDSHCRAQSYADSRRESYTKARRESYSKPRRESYTKTRSESYDKTPSEAVNKSRPGYYADVRRDSYTTTPSEAVSKSRPDYYSDVRQDAESKPRPDSHQKARPDSYTSSRPKSHAGSRPDSYASSQSDSYTGSNSLSYDSEKRPARQHRSHRRSNPFEEPEKKWWTRKRKIIAFSCLGVLLAIIIFTAIGVAVKNRKKGFDYTPSTAQVTNQKSFATGGATLQNPDNTTDGIGMGQDKYTYYFGGPQNFPPSTAWVDFETMWQTNLPGIQKSCTWLKMGEDNTLQESQYIYDAIQDRANASLVDHRYILAVILQESHGCVRVGYTTSSGGVTNPGLMQSHNGDSFVPSHAADSILLMVQDGTQGTEHGAGLVQNLNRYGDPYSASRGYNSGHIAPSGDLSNAAGATACYVSDIANRLTGWVNAQSTCPDAE